MGSPPSTPPPDPSLGPARERPLRPTLDDATPASAASPAPDEAVTTELLPQDGAQPTEEMETAEMPTREIEPAVGDADPAPVAARTGSRVLWVLGAMLLAALVGPLVFWLGFWRFEPTAQRHIPAGTVVAIRADARALFLFSPFRDHVLPALAPPSPEPTRPAMLDRVRTHTGVDLRRDVREIVIASPDAARWALLLGGRFQTSARKGPFVDGFEQAIEAEPGAPAWTRQDAFLVGPAGVAVAQADDGTLLFTSTEDLARAALHATDDYRELWLSSAGDISYSIGHAALLHLGIAARGGFPEAAVLERAERITGWIVLGERESKVVVDVVPRAGEAVEPFGAALDALVKASIPRLASASSTTAPPTGAFGDGPAARALAAKVLAGAKVQVRAESVLITSKAPIAEVEAACREIAALLRASRPR